ncbi:hypothetical protein C0216_33140 (plasmid) [Streptomyces globosus]|uniref:Uncharacterized protein n=1 Tax=Streptomyces globosus TaxID=68209 RepID=A0A344UBM7_9ACTN|nr:hypothetical protein [Streptomyces globosus]AXE28298.1 hypothetical protein C0216_33140 [Streptomyces globosus]
MTTPLLRTHRKAALAAAGALLLSGLAVAPAAAASGPAGTTSGCATLASQGYGWAHIKNSCGWRITATVSVDWAWDPTCIPINAGRTATIHWDGANGRADYAYEC